MFSPRKYGQALKEVKINQKPVLFLRKRLFYCANDTNSSLNLPGLQQLRDLKRVRL